jgi:RHS repeat-associated protein
VVLSNAGTYQFTADSGIAFGNDSPSVVNLGLFEKTAGSGSSGIGVPFNNQGGTVDAESGTLVLNSGTSTGGTYDANGSGVIDLTGGASPTFTGVYTGTGTGLVRLNAGTLNIGAAGATFNFTRKGLFAFSGGTLAGPGVLTNLGTGFMTVTGGTLAATLTNQGSITQTDGTLTISGGLSNQGVYTISLAATGTAITGAGTFTNTSLVQLTTSVVATIADPFANQGGTVQTTAAATTGTLVLGGGGVSTGGTYNATAAGASIDLAGTATSLLSGAYTGAGAGTVGLARGGVLAVNAAGVTLDFTAEAFVDAFGYFNLFGHTLTNAGAITLTNPAQGSTITASVFANNFFQGGSSSSLGGTLLNQGTIDQRGTGAFGMYDNTVISNQDLWQFDADSGVFFGSAAPNSFVNAAGGTVKKKAGAGTSDIDVPFDNQGGTVDAESGNITLSRGGTSTGGTYTAVTGSVIDLTGNGGVTYTGTYTGSGGGNVKLAGGSITVGSGGATFNFPSGYLAWTGTTLSGTLTNAATGFLSFTNLTPGGTFNNLGTLFQSGGTINVINSGSFTDSAGTTNLSGGTGGSLNETGGTVNVSTGTYAGTNTLSGSGGTVSLSGTLTNTGTMSFGGAAISPAYNLNNPTFVGGTIATPNGGQLTATQAGATLNGVTLNGTLFIGQILNTFVNVTNGLTLGPSGLVNEIGNGRLNFTGTETLSGSGVIDFADTLTSNGNKGVYVPNSGTTLTIAPGVLIHGQTGFLGSTTGGLVTNNGTVAADGGGGVITVQGDTNYASGTLTGGTWQVSSGSTLQLLGATITTNAADVLLDGAAAQITSDTAGTSALAQLATNTATGSFTLQDGADFASAQAFTNAGTLTIGSGSTFTSGGTGVYRQTGGNTFLKDGTLGASPTEQVDIQAGTLSGSGTIDANLTNAAEVDLGPSPGTLAIQGNYTQTTGGTLALKVGGASPGSGYDQVNVSGTASLAGTLSVSLVNGYGPATGQIYNVLHAAAVNGGFGTVLQPVFAGTPAFQVQTAPTAVNLIGVVSSPNLAVQTVTFTPMTVAPGQTLTVNYQVQNLGSGAAHGNGPSGGWVDSAYLSPDATLSPDDLLLGQSTHTGDVAGLSTYTGSVSGIVPGLIDGTYFVILVVDGGKQVPDVDRTNNTSTAPAPLALQNNRLSLDTPISGTVADGQDVYFRLNVAPGDNVQVAADFAASLEADMVVGFQYMPTTSAYDLSADDPTDQHPSIQLPADQSGAYYLRLHGREGAGAGAAFTLTATIPPFEISKLDFSTGGNGGKRTIHLTGAGFTPDTTVNLHAGSVVRTGVVDFVDANHLTVQFDLTGLAVGNYTLEADDGVHSATAPFQVIASSGVANITTVLSVPAKVRTGSAIPAIVKITNNGSNDVPLPVLQFTGGSTEPKSITDQTGVLPGSDPASKNGMKSEVSYSATFSPKPSHDHIFHSISVGSLPPTSMFDWSSVEEASRPPSVPSGVWSVIWATFTAAVGNTPSSLQAVLQADEAYFAHLGTPVTDSATLLDFELQKAGSGGAVPTLGDAVDAQTPEPGLPLTFSRTFVMSIAGRYHLGSLGRGWVSNWDISTFTDPATGNVVLQEGAGSRIFLRQGNGTFLGTGGDNATLTLTGGQYSLRELDGTVLSFQPDGRIGSIRDRDGNQITAGYQNGLLTTLTHSDGDKLTLAYDAQGRLQSVTDPVGRVVTYGYDAADEHLTSVTNAQGTTAYTYVTGQGATRENALDSVAAPNGSHLALGYDTAGRLTRLDDGTNAITYGYLTPGGYTITDGVGATSTVLVGVTGQAVAVTDALGNVSHNTVSITLDSKGNASGVVNPLGNATQTTFGPQYNEVSSFKDQQGVVTNFSYNSQGDLQSVALPDGTGSQYVTDSQGLIRQVMNANGQASHYDYNSRGQIIEADYPEGAMTYGYDAHGNLHTVTDASGTTTFDYDAADRLVQVTYPDGKFLHNTYDPFGRLAQSVDQTGFTTNFGYDAFGRLVTVSGGVGGANDPIAAYTYDAAGRLAEKDLGNGTYTVYSYNPDGAVQSVVNRGVRPAPGVDGPVNSRFDYTYDQDGRVSTMSTLSGTTTYGYDAAGQLTSANLPGGRVITYAYDAAGNRTVVSDNGATTTYTTNSLDQYTAAGAFTYGYDRDGNLTVKTGPGGSTTYTYDSRDRLIGVTTPTDTWAYQYDSMGHRTGVTHNGVKTTYLISPSGTVIAEFDAAGNLIAHYTEGLGLTSRVDASGNAAYYDFDALGSTAELTGAGGTDLDTYSYLPFGEVSQATGSLHNPFQYVGQDGVMNDGNGLDFMRARFYSPTTGSFVTRDPLGLAGGTNPYGYARNNPSSFIDPTGTSPIIPDLIIILSDSAVAAEPVSVGTAAEWLDEYVSTDAELEAIYDAPETLQGLGLEGMGGDLAGNFGSDWILEDMARNALSEVGSFASPAPSAGLVADAELAGASLTADAHIVGLAQAGASDATLAAARAALSTSANIGTAEAPAAGLGAGAGTIAILAVADIAIWSLAAYEAYQLYKEWPSNVPVVTSSSNVNVSASGGTEEVGPDDPNFLSGPAGVGPQNSVAGAGTFPYAVFFENQPTASAPALVVTVTQQLDPHLDWATFQLGTIGFGDFTVQVPAGRQSYSTRVDATASLGCFVDVTASLNRMTGVVTCTFTTIDPTTFAVPTGDPFAGFLPPDDETGRGEGSFSYTIAPLSNLPTGSVINAKATVTFDTGLPDQSSLDTAPIFNTIDAGAPTSSVNPLPVTETSPNFTVSWSGQDDAGGSGIASFSVFVSDNGGPFTLWQNQTTQTSAIYNGVNGHTYSFYSVATDNVGNVQPTPAGAQAITTVSPSTTTPISVVSAQTVNAMQGVNTGSVLLATFTQGSATQSASAYTATVAWGDGHSDTSTETNSPISIQVSGQTISVYGSHTYTTAGTQNLSVTLATTGTSAMASPTATVVANVTADVSVKRSGFRYDFTTHEFVQTITLTNTSSNALVGSLALQLTHLSSNATLANASGADANGNPYIDFVTPSSQLAAGQSITVTLYFKDPTFKAITYDTQVWQGF